MTTDRDTIAFEVTEDHLKLLRLMFVGWCGDEYGAPEIDPKRPYGNSDVPRDIAEALGWDLVTSGGEPVVSDEQATEARRLHEETETALQIVLRVGAFEAGDYEADKYRRDWRRADP